MTTTATAGSGWGWGSGWSCTFPCPTPCRSPNRNRNPLLQLSVALVLSVPAMPAAAQDLDSLHTADPATPRFIGDMPHTWVAAEFIRSVLDLLVYERDDALVVGAGVPLAWLDGAGVAVRRLGTRFGALDLQMRRQGDVTRVRLAGDLHLPDGGIVVALPGDRITMNGRELHVESAGAVVRTLPAELEIRGQR